MLIVEYSICYWDIGYFNYKYPAQLQTSRVTCLNTWYIKIIQLILSVIRIVHCVSWMSYLTVFSISSLLPFQFFPQIHLLLLFSGIWRREQFFLLSYLPGKALFFINETLTKDTSLLCMLMSCCETSRSWELNVCYPCATGGRWQQAILVRPFKNSLDLLISDLE